MTAAGADICFCSLLAFWVRKRCRLGAGIITKAGPWELAEGAAGLFWLVMLWGYCRWAGETGVGHSRNFLKKSTRGWELQDSVGILWVQGLSGVGTRRIFWGYTGWPGILRGCGLGYELWARLQVSHLPVRSTLLSCGFSSNCASFRSCHPPQVEQIRNKPANQKL